MYGLMTCTDAKFYFFVHGLARTLPQAWLKEHGLHLHVCDLGLTDTQREVLTRLSVSTEPAALPANAFSLNSANNIRAIHKMDCIEHFLRTRNTGVIVLDADILVLDPHVFEALQPQDDEVVVTARCDREKKPHVLINGLINTGVMAFGRNVPPAFFQAWKDLCEQPGHTDQSALSDLLKNNGVNFTLHNEVQTACGVHVRVLDGNVYNDTSCRTGGIFHFKSAGRRGNKRRWYQIFVALLRWCPSLVREAVRLNRQHRLLVWHPSKAIQTPEAR